MFEIIGLFNTTENFVFTCCLIFCFLLLVIEIIAVVLAGLSTTSFDGELAFIPTSIAGLLGIGKVPIFIWLTLFVGGIGLFGTSLNLLSKSMFGTLINPNFSIPIAILISCISTRLMSGVISKIIPSEKEDTFNIKDSIGMTVVIVTGVAKKGLPAEAKLVDQFKRHHYLMVEPLHDEEFKVGDSVVIWDRLENGFFSVVSIDSLN